MSTLLGAPRHGLSFLSHFCGNMSQCRYKDSVVFDPAVLTFVELFGRRNFLVQRAVLGGRIGLQLLVILGRTAT
jgi:hypothetical protein